MTSHVILQRYGASTTEVEQAMMSAMTNLDGVVASKVLVAFMVIYNFLFILSLVVVASTMISETASTRLRYQAQSVAVFTAWTQAVMWTCVLPYLINPTKANLGAKIGLMYGGFSIFIFIFAFLCIPEYLNRSLEDLVEMFMKGVPARQFRGFACTGEVGHSSSLEKPDATEHEMVAPKAV